jgi:hypothetical protein
VSLLQYGRDAAGQNHLYGVMSAHAAYPRIDVCMPEQRATYHPMSTRDYAKFSVTRVDSILNLTASMFRHT